MKLSLVRAPGIETLDSLDVSNDGRWVLATAYDAAQAAKGDSRRAVRGHSLPCRFLSKTRHPMKTAEPVRVRIHSPQGPSKTYLVREAMPLRAPNRLARVAPFPWRGFAAVVVLVAIAAALFLASK